MRVEMEFSDPQLLTLDLLRDNKHTEIFYGGGAGGGKSWLGCYWVFSTLQQYPGTRALMGRAVLKSLKESTLLTLFQVLSFFGYKNGENYKYYSQEGKIAFENGSEIYLKDLYQTPSDPEFDSLGSTEYTIAFIDEGSQVTEKAKNIVASRLRYKLDEYNLIPKTFIASNPSKNFLYYQFYKPHKEGTLPEFRAFVPALVGDNPFISKHYIANLHKLDKKSKERLLFGNWEYDDDPTKIFDYDKIIDLFTNTAEKGTKYITADIARFGQDKTVVILWDGLFIEKIISYNGEDTKYTAKVIRKLSQEHQIPESNIIVDDDGIGGGVVDDFDNVKGFINGGRPIDERLEKSQDKIYDFKNLKSQCYFELANLTNSGKIGITKSVDEETRNKIIEDLEQIKIKDPDKDNKRAVNSKEEIKQHLGRSPDFSDAMMMRMYFELTEIDFAPRSG